MLGYEELRREPGYQALDHRWIPALLLGLVLLSLGPVFRRLVAPALRPPALALARRLDDLLVWHDAADTALALEGGEQSLNRVEAFHGVQTTGRLREVEPERLWPRRSEGVWIWGTRGLAVLTMVLLLLPGVFGLGGPGPGRSADAGLGASPLREPEVPREADWWLHHFARPLRAEPLRDSGLFETDPNALPEEEGER